MSYWLMEIPDSQLPTLHEFPTEQALVDKLRELVRVPLMQVFVVYGMRGQTTFGALPYYVAPDGRKIPLFSVDHEVEISEDGYLVQPPDFVVDPRPIPSQTAAQQEIEEGIYEHITEDDEDFDEEVSDEEPA